MSEGYKLTIIPFNDTLDGLEYRYTIRENGWQWGHFKTAEEAEKLGKEHLERAIKYGNDWGIPKEHLSELSLSAMCEGVIPYE